MNMENVILGDFIPKAATENSEVHSKTLKKPNQLMQRVCTDRDMSEVLLHNNSLSTLVCVPQMQFHHLDGLCCHLLYTVLRMKDGLFQRKIHLHYSKQSKMESAVTAVDK